MSSRLLCTFIAALISSSQALLGQTPSDLPVPTSQLHFTTKDGNKLIESTSVTFLARDGLYFDPEHEKPVSMVIVQTAKTTVHLHTDTNDDISLTAVAYKGTGDEFPKTKIWEASAPANSGAIGDFFYEASSDTESDDLPIFCDFNLADGTKVYQGNCGILSVIAATKNRFISFRRQFDSPPSGTDNKTFLGILYYGDEHHILHQYVLSGPNADDKPSAPIMDLMLNGRKLDDQELENDPEKDFSIALNIDGETVLNIPFSASKDGPILSSLKLPAEYTLKELPLK